MATMAGILRGDLPEQDEFLDVASRSGAGRRREIIRSLLLVSAIGLADVSYSYIAQHNGSFIVGWLCMVASCVCAIIYTETEGK